MVRSRTMTIVILAGVMGLSMLSSAQQNETYKPAPDAWALQFSIGSNFQLGSFQGALLSIKKHTSPSSAWRLGVGLNGTFTNMEQTLWRGMEDTIAADEDADTDNGGVGIQFQYVHYLALDSDIKPYIAGGPQVGYSKTSQVQLPGRYSSSKSTTEESTVSGGLSFSLGAEWFFAPSMSLMAEYGLYLGYRHTEGEYRYISTDYNEKHRTESSESSFIIDDLGARLGLSVYF